MGIETFELPTESIQVRNLAVNAILGVAFDFFFALAIYKTGPVVVALVSSLVMPTSFVADFIFHNRGLTVLPFVGSAIVIGGLYVMHGGEGEGGDKVARLPSSSSSDEERDEKTLLNNRA